jgi:hypothetical protein
MAKVQKPVRKSWDDMNEEERAQEFKRLQDAEKVATTPDPAFDKSTDQLIRQMARLFGSEQRHPVMLFQVNSSQKAAGQRELPPRECGINGHNFVVPRGIPLELPESLVRILHEAGELNDMQMFQLGLMDMDTIKQRMKLSQAQAQHLATLGQVMENDK